jgi:hypothetical protein
MLTSRVSSTAARREAPSKVNACIKRIVGLALKELRKPPVAGFQI